MLLKPVDDPRQSYAGPCDHEHEPGAHTPFANFRAHCECGAVYLIRGCGDSKGKRSLPPDAVTHGALASVSVACVCGAVASGGVPPEAIPSTLIASRWQQPKPPATS